MLRLGRCLAGNGEMDRTASVGMTEFYRKPGDVPEKEDKMKSRKTLTKAGIFLFLMIAAVMMTAVQGSAKEAKAKWAVYMYMCGSDLESNYGCASTDINEMISAKLPEGVQYVIQTGGAKKWQNNLMNAKKLGRYVYDKKGLRKVGTSPLASMGEKDTLVDFLKFCEKNTRKISMAILMIRLHH